LIHIGLEVCLWGGLAIAVYAASWLPVFLMLPVAVVWSLAVLVMAKPNAYSNDQGKFNLRRPAVLANND
jgi:hypothetical protein